MVIYFTQQTPVVTERQAGRSASGWQLGVVEGADRSGSVEVGTYREGFQERLPAKSWLCIEGCIAFTSSAVLWARRCARL